MSSWFGCKQKSPKVIKPRGFKYGTWNVIISTHGTLNKQINKFYYLNSSRFLMGSGIFAYFGNPKKSP